MNWPEELLEIVNRHEDRLNACGDKLMNAERDLSKVLDILNDKFTPVLMAAKEVHDTRDKPGATPVDLILPLTAMSLALRNAGMVTDKG